jgi:hypothetical protein
VTLKNQSAVNQSSYTGHIVIAAAAQSITDPRSSIASPAWDFGRLVLDSTVAVALAGCGCGWGRRGRMCARGARGQVITFGDAENQSSYTGTRVISPVLGSPRLLADATQLCFGPNCIFLKRTSRIFVTS